MASLDDYDEFGNYIGADLDSDSDDDGPNEYIQQQQAPAASLEGYDDDPMLGTDDNALMEVDRASQVNCPPPTC